MLVKELSHHGINKCSRCENILFSFSLPFATPVDSSIIVLSNPLNTTKEIFENTLVEQNPKMPKQQIEIKKNDLIKQRPLFIIGKLQTEILPVKSIEDADIFAPKMPTLKLNTPPSDSTTLLSEEEEAPHLTYEFLLQQYDTFKEEFWPTLLSHKVLSNYLKEKRKNTVSLTYYEMYINKKRIPESIFSIYKTLIEKHFHSEFWQHFTYKRERFVPRKMRKVIKVEKSPLFKPSIIQVSPEGIPSKWLSYMEELANAMIADGIIQSIKDLHHLKWRKGKLKVQGRVIKGDLYLKYYNIKQKYHSLNPK